MVPPQSHSNLVSDRIYIYSGLLLMVSWWVLYLPKGCRLDFNNGLVGDLNSGLFLAPSVYLSPTRTMAPPRTIPILCHIKYTSVFWWLPYLAKGPMPDFNNGLGNDFNIDVSKQIRHCTGSVHLHERNILVV